MEDFVGTKAIPKTPGIIKVIGTIFDVSELAVVKICCGTKARV